MEDDFDRSDSTFIGPKWVEVVGDSDIYSLTLRVPAGGLVATTWLARDTCMVVYVTLYLMVSGEKYRVVVNYLDDDNYLFADAIGTSTELTLYVGKRVLGSETELGGPYEILGDFVGIAVPLTTCYSACTDREEGILSVSYAENAGLWACAPNTGGRRAGVANEGGVSFRFDDFSLYEHFYSRQDPECPVCVCNCEAYCTEKVLTATIIASSPDNECEDCLDGLELELTYDEETGSFDLSWEGGGVDICDDPDHWADAPFTLRLICEDSDPDLWTLCVAGCLSTVDPEYESEGCQVTEYGAYPASVVCEPFEMVFGPFEVTPGQDPSGASCIACAPDSDTSPSGRFTITITE